MPIEANQQPAFAVYERTGTGEFKPHAIHVLTVSSSGIERVTAFIHSPLFPMFGLPNVLSATSTA